MSVLLQGPPVRTLVAESKDVEGKTSSILIISGSIFVGIILLMHLELMYTEIRMKQYSACRDKIIDFEQSGLCTSTDQFKLALST